MLWCAILYAIYAIAFSERLRCESEAAVQRSCFYYCSRFQKTNNAFKIPRKFSDAAVIDNLSSAFECKFIKMMNWSYKEYPCIEEGCGRTFNTKWTLKRHSAIHQLADNPIYNCNKCDKNFSRKDSLDRHHQMCHSSVVMMYVCSEDGCGKFFGMKSTLYRHMSSHNGSFKCEECWKSFTRKDNLARHKNVHSKNRSINCEQLQPVIKPIHLNSRSCPNADNTVTVTTTDNDHLEFSDQSGGDHTYALSVG